MLRLRSSDPGFSQAFRRLVNDPRFRDLPMLLETPKTEGRRAKGAVEVDPLDARNLRTLRSLVDQTKVGRGRL